MACPTPHPLRRGLDVHPDLQVIGSHATDCWARCKRCGAWFWLVSDWGGKWEYFNDWALDGTLGDRAFIKGDTAAAAKLLVSTNLPYGPVWSTASALLEMLRAITPNASDLERHQALSAAPPSGRWVDAAKLLHEIVTSKAPDASDYAFLFDVPMPGRTLGDWFEVGASLIAFQTAPSQALVRIDGKTASVAPLAGPARFLGRARDLLLFGVATPMGEAVCRMDGAGDLFAFPPTDIRYVTTALDDGWWLFVPRTGDAVRFVEFHRPDAQPRVKIRMAFERGDDYPCPPRRMGDGWIMSGCVDDQDQEQALNLFDGTFKLIAQSSGARGQRLVEVASPDVLWAETRHNPFVLERWVRRTDKLERTFELEVQSWCRVEGGVVVAPRESTSGLLGLDDDEHERFRLPIQRAGAVYMTHAPGGLLVYDNARARLIDPRTSEDVIPPFEVEAPHVFETTGGTVYLRDRAALWILAKDRQERVFVGEQMAIETTCGDDVLLRDAAGVCLVFGPDGVVKGRFSAKEASFSVIGTRGGPYVVERQSDGTRVRIARFPS